MQWQMHTSARGLEGFIGMKTFHDSCLLRWIVWCIMCIINAMSMIDLGYKVYRSLLMRHATGISYSFKVEILFSNTEQAVGDHGRRFKTVNRISVNYHSRGLSHVNSSRLRVTKETNIGYMAGDVQAHPPREGAIIYEQVWKKKRWEGDMYSPKREI